MVFLPQEFTRRRRGLPVCLPSNVVVGGGEADFAAKNGLFCDFRYVIIFLHYRQFPLDSYPQKNIIKLAFGLR
jgi:hypothetical protein